jgi:hypothetical protein
MYQGPSWSCGSMIHYVVKFVSDLRQVHAGFSTGIPVASTNKTDCHDITEIWYSWNIVESGVKHHNPNTSVSNVKLKATDWILSIQDLAEQPFHIKKYLTSWIII